MWRGCLCANSFSLPMLYYYKGEAYTVQLEGGTIDWIVGVAAIVSVSFSVLILPLVPPPPIIASAEPGC